MHYPNQHNIFTINNQRRSIMVKGFCSILLMTVLVTSIGIGGIKPVKRHIMDEPTSSNPTPVQERGTPGVQSGLSWELVDTSQNCYGMLTNGTDPVSYDPLSGYVGVIHRGKTSYAAGSGELWYNTSPDGSMGSWSRIAALNSGQPNSSRYPSAWIQGFGGPGAELFAFSAPQLTSGGVFGWVIYGVDLLNQAATFAVEDQGDGSYWSNTRITAADDSPYIWWGVREDPATTTHNSLFHLWRTMDYGVIDQFDPWPLTMFSNPGVGFEVGMAYRNGTLYIGGANLFPGDPQEVLNVFYTSSADDGTTWGPAVGPNIGVGDWRTVGDIAGSAYDDWHSPPAPGGPAFDMLVDYQGYVHILGVLVDNDDPNANLAVVDVFETASGWDAEFISEDLVASTKTNYGAVDQMGYHVGGALSADGMAMVAVWLSAAAPGDTLPDIWMSTKHLAGGSWSTPENLTVTPDYAELLLHIAPILRNDGGDLYTAFIARSYEQGVTAYPPIDTNPSDIFVSTVQRTITVSSVEPTPGVPSVYKLEQNYPNPFNPTTNIRYSIPNSSFVSLKVFDMLGQEVATLYNGYQDAGSYVADFDASNLANGTYYYTLTAGSFSETKKMLLLK
jgi:hypothetical protein